MSDRLRFTRALPRILCTLLAGALAAACASKPEYTAEQLAVGTKAYLSTCATCHGKDARGLPKLGKDLHANAFVNERSDEEMLAFLKTGRPASHPLNTTGVDMPPKGGNPALTDEEMTAIVGYLRSLE